MKGGAVISLFSGALGLDLGLERAGFQIRVAVECNKFAAETIRKNRPDIVVLEKDIREVTTKEVLDAAGLKPGEPAVVTGGPSCATFSTVGQRGSLAAASSASSCAWSARRSPASSSWRTCAASCRRR